MEFLADNYMWLKVAHLFSVFAWMAGLFYLPRLFAYHTTVNPGSEASELLKVMERRLLKIIMNPAMIASFVFGMSAAFDDFFVLCQVVFVHVFVGMKQLPPSVRVPFTGLHIVQFMEWLPSAAR